MQVTRTCEIEQKIIDRSTTVIKALKGLYDGLETLKEFIPKDLIGITADRRGTTDGGPPMHISYQFERDGGQQIRIAGAWLDVSNGNFSLSLAKSSEYIILFNLYEVMREYGFRVSVQDMKGIWEDYKLNKISFTEIFETLVEGDPSLMGSQQTTAPGAVPLDGSLLRTVFNLLLNVTQAAAPVAPVPSQTNLNVINMIKSNKSICAPVIVKALFGFFKDMPRTNPLVAVKDIPFIPENLPSVEPAMLELLQEINSAVDSFNRDMAQTTQTFILPQADLVTLGANGRDIFESEVYLASAVGMIDLPAAARWKDAGLRALNFIDLTGDSTKSDELVAAMGDSAAVEEAFITLTPVLKAIVPGTMIKSLKTGFRDRQTHEVTAANIERVQGVSPRQDFQGASKGLLPATPLIRKFVTQLATMMK